MKFLRFKNKADSLNHDLKIKSGFLDDDGKVIELKGDILDYHKADMKKIKEKLDFLFEKIETFCCGMVQFYRQRCLCRKILLETSSLWYKLN